MVISSSTTLSTTTLPTSTASTPTSAAAPAVLAVEVREEDDMKQAEAV